MQHYFQIRKPRQTGNHAQRELIHTTGISTPGSAVSTEASRLGALPHFANLPVHLETELPIANAVKHVLNRIGFAFARTMYF